MTHPLAGGSSPRWAVEWGEDRESPFVAFAVGGSIQRMRWMWSGRFWMGSPTGETSRWGREGPRHEVRLSSGFWLGETAVTQRLWEAVMGSNPSRFQSVDRPVEQVSWFDAVLFCNRLSDQHGLEPAYYANEEFGEPFVGEGQSVFWQRSSAGYRLPTEAEWEYACRAGTSGATWRGALDILGINNAPLLDDIAWYGGNSGMGFELGGGYRADNWLGKQYEFDRAGTRVVCQKQANPWGLYDMLGNVWEWCVDTKKKHILERYSGELRIDPVSLPGAQAEAIRVVRGGSWRGHARSVRAACRDAYSPTIQTYDVGFRLARGPLT